MAGIVRPRRIDMQRTRDEIAALVWRSKQTIEDARKIDQDLATLRSRLNAADERTPPTPAE